VDEGNNWINVSWGPLSLTNDALAGGPNGNYGGGVLFGDYALTAIPANTIPTSQPHPPTDFFGHVRPETNGDGTFDPGAVEFEAGTGTATMSVTPTSLAFGSVAIGTTSAPQTLTLNNTGGSTATGIALTFTGPYARPAAAAGGTCGATLAAGASCTINVTFHPTVGGSAPGTLAIAASVPVTGSPVTITGTSPVGMASVTPTTLAFGNQGVGTTSATMNVTVANTGTVALAGGTFTLGGGNPQPFSRVTTGTFPAGAPNCGATLAIGASCTIKVQFAPLTAVAFSKTLTVAYNAGTIVTGSPVTLTGTGTAPGTLSFTSATNGTLSTVGGVRQLTFTIPTSRAAVTSVVTITNSGAGSLQITAEAIIASNPAGIFTLTGTTCSFTTPLAPNGTCSATFNYATPTARPTPANLGAAQFTNNGSNADANGHTSLLLSGR
jgi:hypothetical protein